MIRYGLIGAGAVGRKRATCLKPGQLASVFDVETAARGRHGRDSGTGPGRERSGRDIS